MSSTAGQALAASARMFGQQTSALLTVVLLAALAVLVAACLPRRRLAAAAAGVSLAVVLGVTVTPTGGWGALGFETGALRSIAANLEPHRSALVGWWRNSDGPANVLLFLPAGLFVAWLTRRPVLTAIGLTALSFAIECWQSTLTTRVGSFDDVVANGLGAALGAAVAAVALGITVRARRTAATSHAGGGDQLAAAVARKVRR